MIELNCGCNFSLECCEGLVALNEKYKSSGARISQVYGTVQGLKGINSARPDSRVPNIDDTTFAARCNWLSEHGIKVNLTANALEYNDVEALLNTLRWLHSRCRGAVEWVTIANFELLTKIKELSFKEISGLRFKVELSTICQVWMPSQIRWLLEKTVVEKVCLDIYSNRDALLLATLKSYGMHDKVELLVNEFCIVDGVPCPFRQNCYLMHSKNTHPGPAGFPMKQCIAGRRKLVDWVRAPFILPRWLDDYAGDFGITKFKVSGRSHPTAYILKIAEAYLNREFDGTLRELWAQLETIDGADQDLRYKIEYDPRTEELDSMYGDLLDPIDSQMSCRYQVCGKSCKYCFAVARRLIYEAKNRRHDDGNSQGHGPALNVPEK